MDENPEYKGYKDVKEIKEQLSLIMIQINRTQEQIIKLQETVNLIATGTLMLSEEQSQKTEENFKQLKDLIEPIKSGYLLIEKLIKDLRPQIQRRYEQLKQFTKWFLIGLGCILIFAIQRSLN